MFIRKCLMGAAVTATLALGAVVPVHAAAPAVPYASSLAIKLVTPSTIASTGAYSLQIVQLNPSVDNAYFDLYRYTSAYGTQSLGYYSGTQTTDLEQTYFGYTYYYEYIYNSSGTCGSCNPVYTPGFYPTVTDNPFYIVAGHVSTVYSSRYYGGSAENTTSGIGTRVSWNTNYNYNFAVVVGTGPLGGIGTLYVDGVKKGTINFHSSGLQGMKELFKFGTPGTSGPVAHTVTIVVTAKGSTGGTQMWLDAGVEDEG